VVFGVIIARSSIDQLREFVPAECRPHLQPSFGWWCHADQQDQAFRAGIPDAVGCAGGCPNDVSQRGLVFDVVDGKDATAFEYQVKLILVSMVVDCLRLPGLEAVQAKHQEVALKERGFVEFRRIAADMLAVIGDVALHMILSPSETPPAGAHPVIEHRGRYVG
jgi:hypothetical protein